ncbi:MAG: hypothetical protein JOZ90_02740 [Alphaproteobacteria bacterium]|nr:hypothetical protein [Alphaproteobacteria bacterium]MBV9370642.1 hypothetical protein [Alphaproteobacteria bacterium]MBV9899994.1 hypothetical protein [Alphaproteobacteria bacterium]
MVKGWTLVAIAGLLQLPAPLHADCAPAGEIASRMDAYFAAPRSPATYRALAGLGDPRIEPFDYFAGDWRRPDDEKALAARMIPSSRPDHAVAGYIELQPGDCRIGYAIETAKARIAALGAAHPYVRRWFEVQRAVFAACSNPGAALPALPPPLATADPRVAALQREDRAYQAASRLFYEHSAGAQAAFERIASSPSVHAPTARYMVAAMSAAALPSRGWESGGPPGEGRPGAIDRLVRQERAILRDPALASVHPLAQALIGSAAYRNGDPRLREEQVRLVLEALHAPLARLRADPSLRERYARALADIDKLHDNFPDPAWWISGTAPPEATASRAMAAAARSDPIAAWVLTPASVWETAKWAGVTPSGERDGRLQSFVRGRSSEADREAWALVQASGAPFYDAGAWTALDGKLAEARRCAGDAHLAALPASLYHQVRTALASGDAPGPEPRAFEAALSHLAAWPWKDSEHYRATVSAALRFLVARGRTAEARRLRDSLPQQARAGNDVPLLLLAEDRPHLLAALLQEEDYGRPVLLNRLSAGALASGAGEESLSREDRARFARVAWTRLYALGRRVPPSLDAAMRALNPEIAAGWISRPGAGPRDRRLLLDVLRSPGLNILITEHQRRPDPGSHNVEEPGLTRIDTLEHSDNNWWCAWQAARHERDLDRLLYDEFFGGPERWRDPDPLRLAGARPLLARLLGESWLWRSHAGAEEEALARIDCAPKALSEAAIDWASHRRPFASREGQDEALALAVRTTRYGCQRQGGHGAYSKAAFQLLHDRFPDSPAAKRTRYWFDCSHFYGGCPPTPAKAP